MTTKQYKNEINFVKQEVVSVSEKERSQRLEFLSFIIAGLTLVITITVSFFKIYTISKLTTIKDTEVNLIAQIQAPDLRHKEELFFLTKNRLVKIREIDSTRTKALPFLKTFSEINKLMKIEDFSLSLSAAKVTISTADYSRFEDFLAHLADFHIDKKNMIVNSVSYEDSKFNIKTQFVFKRQ